LAIGCSPRFALAVENGTSKPLDFNRDVRPILSENCFQCHGFDEKSRQADLRLDMADSALAGHDGVAAIVPGHPEQSELWRRITTDHESELMPPPDSHRALKPPQKELLKRWIEQGAPYAKHWSFIPPVKPAVPDVGEFLRNSRSSLGEAHRLDWPRNEIDNFILARLQQEHLQPSPEADRRTLIRRLYLDLTGLPPSAAEVESFVADKDPHAYEQLVDRLLASPHFGERMALVWLDAARYADTNGYSIDGGRHMWLWRDWVINAFNTNLPYDQFIRDQLAGDLIPNHTEAQLIATGFQRNNMNTHEGGTIPEENLTNYNVDRVKTFGEAMLGLTLGCCQCHDHKFDPLTQKDYYQIYAYFNTLSDIGLDGNAGVNSRPVYSAKTVLQTGEQPELQKQIAALKEKLANPDPADIDRWLAAQRLRLSARGKNLELHAVELLKVSTPNTGAGFDIDPPRFVHISSPAALVAYDVSLKLPQLEKPITGLRVVFHPDAKAPHSGLGYGELPTSPTAAASLKRRGKRANKSPIAGKGTFILTAFSASADPVPGDQVNLNRLLNISQVTADSWLPAWRPEGVLDTRNENGWSPDDGEFVSATGKVAPAHLTVTFDKPVDTRDTPYMTVQLNFGHGNSLVAARFELLAMTGADDDSDLPEDIIELVQSPAAPSAPGSAGGYSESGEPAPLALNPSSLTPGATDSASGATGSASASLAPRASHLVPLRQYFSDHSEFTKRDRIALANLEERLNVVTQKHPTMVMDIAEKPRDTFILHRGDYQQPTEKVTPGTPAVLPQLPSAPGTNQLAPSGATGSASAISTRLDLANWMTMREHPLTARVEVNRLWQIFFGTGLVATPADFGAQGEYPSHPDLLDWLAVDFMDHGWDVKRLIKQIVTSSTYRQTSDTGPRQLAQSSGATLRR